MKPQVYIWLMSRDKHVLVCQLSSHSQLCPVHECMFHLYTDIRKAQHINKQYLECNSAAYYIPPPSQNLSIPQCWYHVLSVLTAKLPLKVISTEEWKGSSLQDLACSVPRLYGKCQGECFECYSQCWCMIKREQTLLNNSICRDVDLSFLGLIGLPKLCIGGFSLATTWYRTRHTFDCPKGHGNISLYTISMNLNVILLYYQQDHVHK